MKMTILGILIVLMMIPTWVLGKGWTVGDNKGWISNVNYTLWTKDIQFHKGDWLIFVFDRNTQNVLEVNKNSSAIVPLDEPKKYFFISEEEFCLEGVKVSIDVVDDRLGPKE
ncbi:hypothetical protein MKW92_007897 [Papaver armeniacum]|nr:hypothetical protein MKW92_007897 [Papaver armeniacum]